MFEFDISHLVEEHMGWVDITPALKSFINDNPEMKHHTSSNGGWFDPNHDSIVPMKATIHIRDEKYAVLFRMTFG